VILPPGFPGAQPSPVGPYLRKEGFAIHSFFAGVWYNFDNHMKKNVTRFWAAVVVIILVVVAVVVWKYYGVTPPAVGVPAYAPTGQLTSGFPTELIWGNDPTFSQSYSINYSSSTNQYTAVFDSADPMELLYADYTDYFAGNGWTIANATTPSSPTLRGLYAVKANAVAGVVLSDQGAKRHVVVSYSLTSETPSNAVPAPVVNK
jgi:hypothetical protein